MNYHWCNWSVKEDWALTEVKLQPFIKTVAIVQVTFKTAIIATVAHFHIKTTQYEG